MNYRSYFLKWIIYLALLVTVASPELILAQNELAPDNSLVQVKRFGDLTKFKIHDDIGFDSIVIVAEGSLVRELKETIISQHYDGCPKDEEIEGQARVLTEVTDYVVTIKDCNGNYKKWKAPHSKKDDYEAHSNLCTYLGSMSSGTNSYQEYERQHRKGSTVIEGKFMFRPFLGYNFPIANGMINTTTNYTNNTVSGVYGSAAEGITTGFDLGYKIKPYCTLVLGIRGDIEAPKLKTNSTYTDSSNNFYTDNYAGRFSMAVFSFGTDFNILNNSKVKPFAGCGIDIGLAGKYTNVDNITIADPSGAVTDNIVELSTMSMFPGYGAYAELGIEVLLTNHITFFGEARLDAMSLLPNKQVVTSATDNGTNILNSLLPSQIETDFVKTISQNANTNAYAPSQELTSNLPVSGVSINLGFVFWF